MELVNRVANSGLITINLEDYFPKGEIVEFDLKDYLFMELILKEKDFRAALKALDWEQYRDKQVAVFCSADAIIPMWAYMLVASYLAPVANNIVQAQASELITLAYHKVLNELDLESFKGGRIIIKGCSDKPVPAFAYTELTKLLIPIAKSVMFGEPCSTVPVFKQKRK